MRLSSMSRLPGAIPAISVAIGSNSAFAQTRNFGEIAEGLTDQLGAFANLVGVIAVVIGLAMLVMSGVKFRAYSTNPQDPSASISGSVGWLLAGVALVALPEFLGVGVTSLFGDSADLGTLAGDTGLN